MARYVVLVDWTEQGVRGFKETVDRFEAASARVEALGGRFVEQYWTLGSHDSVAVVDAPDDQTLAAGLLAIASGGAIRTTTLRAFTADEMRDVVAKVG
jgi:uncharacterized protein with GYD domain